MRAILVGVGGFGKQWCYAIEQTPGVRVVALVEPNEQALREGAEHFGVPSERCFSNPQDRWEEAEGEFVIDSTGHHLHLQNAVRSFAAGKDYIVCKPMADEWASGKRMVEECRKHGRKMVVAQQLRYHPLILKLREIVGSGILGRISCIFLDWIIPRSGRYIGQHRSWRQPHPLFVECSIHHLDYLRWVLNRDALWAWGDTWIAPWDNADFGMHHGWAAYELTGGCKLSYRATRVTGRDRGSWLCDWHIEGEKGWVQVRGDRIYLNGKQQEVGWPDRVNISNLRLDMLNGKVLEEFLRYVRDGEEPGISGENNLNSLHMCFGAIESSETGRRVKLYRRDEEA